MPASYNIETSFLRCQHIFRWPPSPSLEPVSNYLHSEWGNHTTFAQPPSPFRPRSGVVPIPPLFPERCRTITERGTRFEWQERKLERLVVADRSTLVRDRSGHFPQHWWSFRHRSVVPSNEDHSSFHIVLKLNDNGTRQFPFLRRSILELFSCLVNWNDTGTMIKWHWNDVGMRLEWRIEIIMEWLRNDARMIISQI